MWYAGDGLYVNDGGFQGDNFLPAAGRSVSRSLTVTDLIVQDRSSRLARTIVNPGGLQRQTFNWSQNRHAGQ
jgi:hypothetical protein